MRRPPDQAKSFFAFGRKEAGLVLAALLVGIVVFAVQTWKPDPHRAVKFALERRDFKQAIQLLEDRLLTNPGDAESQLLAAQTFRRMGDVQEARQRLQRCEGLTGLTPEVQQERRLLRIQMGDVAEAEELWAACDKEPWTRESSLILEASIEGYQRRFITALPGQVAGGGQLESAAADMKRAQAMVDVWLAQQTSQADQLQGHIWRGKLHALAREYPLSQAAFRQAIALEADNAVAREYLGMLLMNDVPDEAAGHLEVAHRLNDKSVKIAFALASVYRSLGRQEQAQQLLDELLERHPNDAMLLVERGRLALDQQQPQEAGRWLHRAVTIAPNNAQANLMLSRSLEQMGRGSEAKKYREIFLKIEADQRATNRGKSER